jgi:hypothetical protein
MDNFVIFKKPLQLLYIISGYLSTSEIIYGLMYSINSIKDGDNTSNTYLKISIMNKIVLLRLLIIYIFAYMLTTINIENFYIKLIICTSAISHIVYLTVWQLAYFFNLSNAIEDLSRYILSNTEQLYLTIINFLEVIGAFAIIYFFLLDDFSINHITKISHIYYSFVNITTLGFGDIYPTSIKTQVLTICELLIGVLYLIINLPILTANRSKK